MPPLQKHQFNKPAGASPRPTTKGVRENFSYSFSHALLARYSVLHLLGVLSGGNKPPLCKGRWLAQARRRDCKSKSLPQDNPSAAFGVSSLYTREPLVCASRKSVYFSSQALLLWTQKRSPARGGASNYSDAFLRILAMKSLSLPSKSASSILIILSL